MYYNIYYQNSKVNKKPLTDKDVEYIRSQKVIYKRNEVKDSIEEINTNQIRIISCEII